MEADQLGLKAIGARARYFVAYSHLFGGELEKVGPLVSEVRIMAPESVDIMLDVDDLEGLAAWLDGDVQHALTVFELNRSVARLLGVPPAQARAQLGERVFDDPTALGRVVRRRRSTCPGMLAWKAGSPVGGRGGGVQLGPRKADL